MKGTELRRGVVYYLLGFALPAIGALAALPLLARLLGPERLGILVLAWTTLGYASALQLGLGPAVTQASAGQNPTSGSRVSGLVWTALSVAAAAGVAGTVAILAGAPFLVRLLQMPPHHADEAVTAFRVIAAAVPIVVTAPVLVGLLQARGRFGAINAVAIPVSLVTYLGPVVVLHFADGLIPVVGVLVASRVVAWAAYFVLCSREVPGLARGVRPSRRLAWPLLRFGGWSSISGVVSPLMVYCDRFVIGSAAGAAAVAYYAAPQEVVLRLGAVSGAFAAVLFPSVAAAHLRGSAEVARLMRRGVDGVAGLVLPIACCVAAFAPEALHTWMGAEFAGGGSTVLRWLAFGLFVNSLAKAPSSMLLGIGRPDIPARLHLLELPLYAAALLVLVPAAGLEGAAMAWVGRVTLDAAAQFTFAARCVPGVRPTSLRALVLATVGAALMWGISAVPAVELRAVVAALVAAAAGTSLLIKGSAGSASAPPEVVEAVETRSAAPPAPTAGAAPRAGRG